MSRARGPSRHGALSHIRDPRLAASGRSKIEWAEGQMPVLLSIRQRAAKTKPLSGLRVACCLHVTTETAHLMLTLKAAGAQIALCASNPLSTQDDVAASLVSDFGISVYAIRGENRRTYYQHIERVLGGQPHITMDDGADLVSTIHKQPERFGGSVIGGTEETTTGVIRLKSLDAQGKLRYPVIAVNDADTKHLFDNRYGTGQSTIDGILRATNRLIAGSVFVVAGYGWCGKGLAQRAKGMGGRVIVTEIHPVKGLEAVMDGFEVMPMASAAALGDIFVTVTGCSDVLRQPHFLRMKDGAIVSNSGHFDVEINLEELRRLSKRHHTARNGIDQFLLKNGRTINVLAEGRLVNLACAEGHPPGVMDMSFANQALAAEYLKREARRIAPHVYPVPKAIDQEIARLKLKAMGVSVDTLTPEQEEYLSSWELGT
ncbi:MAG: adenosylhomocysteinase [Candidatus Omnitrophica bacterium]|nr:adenosylhomocysteinase [Candidatus Omnitrophota bacterium]